MTTLKLNIYVLLPDGAIKSPFRKTEYVIPKDTLSKIVKNNDDLIGAVVRDAVSEFLMILNEGWRQACIGLIVILTLLVLIGAVTFGIIQMHKWYSWKRHRTVIISSSNLQKCSPQKLAPDTQVQTTSFMKCADSLTSPSTSSTRPMPDDQSLLNVSEGSTSSSGRSSANRHWCRTHTLLQKLESVASQSSSTGNDDYNHPHAVELESGDT